MVDSESKSLPPAAFFGIIAVAVLLISGIGFYTIMPRGPAVKAPPTGSSPRPESPLHRWVKEKYAETGGDWNKLSPADQGRLMQSGQGNGQAFFETVGKPK